MTKLTRADVLELVAEATLAPSAHNAQPARWRVDRGGQWELLEDVTRRLPFADPSGKDATVSLGAAFEGLSLAMSRRGLSLSEPVFASTDGDTEVVPVSPFRSIAKAEPSGRSDADPLAAVTSMRRTYRGAFVPFAHPHHRLQGLAAGAPDVVLVEDVDTIRDLARTHDEASYDFLRAPESQSELYEWMRFTPGHPAWERDGMSAPCLNMSGLTGRVASTLFRPGGFRFLKAIGLARPLTSEAAVTRSASALLVISRLPEDDWFAAGRRFYRVWLELTEMGLSACPMSLLVDDPAACAELKERAGLDSDTVVTNVLRVGVAPERGVPKSARLPAEEVLLP